MPSHEASPAQQRFWLLDQLGAPEDVVHTIALLVRFDGPLELDRLATALRAVIEVHEVVRSCFRWEGDRLMADVLPLDAIEIAESGSRTQASENEPAVVRRLQELAEEPFDLARGPLLRPTLLADGPERTYLLLVVHHIVWDGWSNGVLLRELATAYADGRCAASDVSYWTYAESKRAAGASAVGERDLAFWRTRLEGPAPPAPLAAQPRDEGPTPTLHRATLPFDPGLDAEVAACARAHAVLPAGVYAAALTVVMAAAGLGDETSLGVVLADRASARFDNVIGCCLNTVALRSRVAWEETFEQVLLSTHDALAEALVHGTLPFETVVHRLGMGRGERLLQALLSFHDVSSTPVAVGPALAVARVVPARAGQVMTVLTVALDDNAPELVVEWNGQLVRPAAELLEQWRQALERGMRAPQTRVAELCDLRRPATVAVSTAAEPLATTVPALLRARAEAWPDATALVHAGGQLSFAELLRDADAVARRLRAAGIQPGTAVGVGTQRSAAAVIAMLGIQEAGATCVALDPAYPQERLRFILEDSGASVVLTDGPADAWGEVPLLAVDASGPPPATLSPPSSDPETGWIFYTSGSSGRPKGVLLGHRTIVARLLAEPIPWRPGDRGCHKSSFSYGDSLWEILAPLAHGCAAAIADVEEGRDPRLLSRLVERAGVTHLLLVPALLRALLQLPDADRARLAGITTCLATGEVLTGALAEDFYRVLPDATLIDMYGTTECWEVCWHPVPRDVRVGDAVPIGTRLLDGVQVAVVDEQLEPVPAGTPGELLVSGPGLSRGYVNRPELTAERFLRPPQRTGLGDRAYRTGDLVVRRDGGTLEIAGRRDLQVNLRGFRIELEEVERWLRASPDVTDGAVVAERDADGTVVGLTALVVSAEGREPNAAALRRELGRHLPDHCLPSSWVRLAQLPLLSNGKVDRSALASLAHCRPAPFGASTAGAQAAPRSEREAKLVRIWRDLLGVDQIEVTDDFFDLGGSSLLAVQVVIRVEQELGAEIPLREFYQRPTIASLDAILSG